MYDALAKRLADRGLVIDQAKLANHNDLVDKLKLNLTDNKTFLATASPTNAQNAAHIKQLTRQVNRLIRLAINDLTASE